MDNQEAIRLMRNLPTMCEFTDAYGEPIDSDAYYEAVDIAISALHAQDAPDINVGGMKTQLSAEGTTNLQPTCNKLATDTISRQAAIDEIEYELEMINSALDSITLDFNARERLRQRSGEAREILNSIQQLPSAQPERKKGKWQIYVISPFDGEGCKCSECKYEGVPYWDFCPNCGAKMEVEHDTD